MDPPIPLPDEEEEEPAGPSSPDQPDPDAAPVDANLFLIGPRHCGKSAFLHRLSRGEFDPNAPDDPALIRVKRGTTELTIRLSTLSLLPGAAAFFNPQVPGAFLCFDLTDHTSFDALIPVAKAVTLLRDFSCVLLGMKADRDAERDVSAIAAGEFAASRNWAYFETSASAGWSLASSLRELAARVFRDRTIVISPEFDRDIAPVFSLELPPSSDAPEPEPSVYVWAKVLGLELPGVGPESDPPRYTVRIELVGSANAESVWDSDREFLIPVPVADARSAAFRFAVEITYDGGDSKELISHNYPLKRLPIAGKIRLTPGDKRAPAILEVDVVMVPSAPDKRPRTPIKKATELIARRGGDPNARSQEARVEADRIYRERVIDGMKRRRMERFDYEQTKDSFILENEQVMERQKTERDDPAQMGLHELRHRIRKMEEQARALDEEILLLQSLKKKKK
jgi:hypothetical protein